MIQKEITSFIVDRTARQLSPKTIEFYEKELRYASAWWATQSVTHMDQLTADLIRQYLIQLGKTRNPGGVHATWRTLRAWCNWYSDEIDNPALRNAMAKVSPPKVSSAPIRGISVADIRILLAACDPAHITGRRDKAIILFLFDTGARKEEFAALNVGDIDMKTGAVQIHHGKGNKHRVVYLGANARRELTRYLRTRPEAAPTDPLWLNQNKTRLLGAGLRQMLRRRSEAADIPEPSPHDFRRSFAIESLRNGIDLVTLMHLMGHTDTVVLQRYLKLVENDLQKGHEKSSPGDALK